MLNGYLPIGQTLNRHRCLCCVADSVRPPSYAFTIIFVFVLWCSIARFGRSYTNFFQAKHLLIQVSKIIISELKINHLQKPADLKMKINTFSNALYIDFYIFKVQ